ncbi:MAG TPA: hypothetical protein VF717_06595 [Pyrinomonadaceae bacterium]
MKAYVARDKDDTLWLCSSEPAFIDDEIGMVCDFILPLFDEDYAQFSHVSRFNCQQVSVKLSPADGHGSSEEKRERSFIQNHGG